MVNLDTPGLIGHDNFIFDAEYRFIESVLYDNISLHISFPDTTEGDMGEEDVSIPIYMESDATGLEIDSLHVSVSYNPEVILFSDINNSETLTEGWAITVSDTISGNVKITALSEDYMEGNGTMFNLLFDVIGDGGEESDLVFNQIKFNGGDIGGIPINGLFMIPSSSSIANSQIMVPNSCVLYDNYPNPFNPSTTIAYQIPVGTYNYTTLRIYDTMGRLVRTLVDEKQDAGYHTVKWHGIDDNGKRVPSGAYVYRLETTDGYEETRKMILLK
jgi:hypothetical protein